MADVEVDVVEAVALDLVVYRPGNDVARRQLGAVVVVGHAVSATGTCTNGRVGDGNWDRDAYFRSNYRRSDGTYWTGGTGAGT